MTRYLSHIRLARSPDVLALAPLLTPSDPAARHSAQHNLLWSIFADGPDRQRDFLWREEQDGSFLTLSARAPAPSQLFQPHQIREFAPILAPGDRLAFKLRCNATRMKRTGARVDVVMDALHGLPRPERAAQRMVLASREGQDWLARQGAKAGFHVMSAEATDYSTQVLPGHRGPRKGQRQFGILDLTGIIGVTDPETFRACLALGFGRAKAFGCGLMLIRRVA